MSGFAFEGVARLIETVVLLSILLVAVPAGVWAMASCGVRMPQWLLYAAKGLTLLFSIVLVLIVMGLAAIVHHDF